MIEAAAVPTANSAAPQPQPQPQPPRVLQPPLAPAALSAIKMALAATKPLASDDEDEDDSSEDDSSEDTSDSDN